MADEGTNPAGAILVFGSRRGSFDCSVPISSDTVAKHRVAIYDKVRTMIMHDMSHRGSDIPLQAEMM